MPTKQPPKYKAPKSHFHRRPPLPPLTPAPAYSAPSQWTPPSSPILRWTPPSSPAPPTTLPSFSIPKLDVLASVLFPSEEHLSRPTSLPLFRANHLSTPPPARLRWRSPRSPLAPCHPYRHQRRLVTLLLVAGLACQLATLVILVIALARSDSRPFGGALKPSLHSTGPEDSITQASLGNSQSTTPET